MLRVVAHNALFAFIGLGLIALVGEAYLRLTTPASFRAPVPLLPLHFVQGVGLLLKPNVEVHYTNHFDYFSLSHTNSLGFLDREPIGPERAAASCHIAMIGDSFVEAKEIPIADKFHVRLEALAARHLPHLDITTAAYGFRDTGQINQLPYYDEYARHLSPKLVVLVFVGNDLTDNSWVLKAFRNYGPLDLRLHVTAQRGEDGTLTLRHPTRDDKVQAVPPSPLSHRHWYADIVDFIISRSYFALRLKAKWDLLSWPDADYFLAMTARAKLLSRYPGYASLLDEWRLKREAEIWKIYQRKTLPPIFERELAFTAFALDQFKERTERDGASLVILATYTMGTRGHPTFDRLNALAEARGIPVIDQYDYIRRQGADPESDSRWTHDDHWNVNGHRWAAKALLEYLEENPRVCTRPTDAGTP